MKNSFLLVLFSLTSLLASAQPDMTLWRVFEDHTDKNSRAPELYQCGNYYFFFSEEVASSTWSIKNEGNENLTIKLPLVLDKRDVTSIEITEQPTTSTLRPGEETHFKLRYNVDAFQGDVFLNIGSNDPEDPDCGLMVGGNFDIPIFRCLCFCNDMNETQTFGRFCLIDDTRTDRFFSEEDALPIGELIGILIGDGPCQMEGETCSPFRITDPCSCENTTTTSSGEFLFVDELVITTLPGVPLMLTSNNSGFKDSENVPIPPGTILGISDATGEMKYTFYRAPGEQVDIIVNGTPFMSADICPSESDCIPLVPTLSQWGLILLSIILMIFGVAAVRKSMARLELG